MKKFDVRRDPRPKIISERRTGRKSMTIPDQSMSIKEIVRRFVKGIPPDVVQREAVYVDQTDVDLEKLARADFAEKAAYADEFRARAEQVKADFNDELASAKERAKKSKADQKAEPKGPEKAGIGSPLDNTMPDDTTLPTK